MEIYILSTILIFFIGIFVYFVLVKSIIENKNQKIALQERKFKFCEVCSQPLINDDSGTYHSYLKTYDFLCQECKNEKKKLKRKKKE